jgi:hypothetical protein
MKRTDVFGAVMMLLTVSMLMVPAQVNAQEEESSSPFSVGGDLVSSYLWRGIKFGTGPAIQPYVELALGNFAIGGWGSYNFTSNEAAEADLYLSYGFDFGLSIGLTDYYFPGGHFFTLNSDSTLSHDYSGANYLDYSSETGSHAFEINLGYEIKGFSIAANYVLNESAGAASAGGDMYFELGYSFDSFGFFVGAGDGWHSSDGEFALTNIGVSASTEIEITESFSLPVSGALILNPDTEQFHVVVGVSF